METLYLIGGMKISLSIIEKLKEIQNEKCESKFEFVNKVKYQLNKLDISKQAKIYNHLISQILEN